MLAWKPRWSGWSSIAVCLCFLCVLAAPRDARCALGAASQNPTPTQVTRVSYAGWPVAYRITNGVVELVVVPEIGRIMSFRYVGEPDSECIWRNPDMLGHAPVSSLEHWSNLGGDKLWPADQDDWSLLELRGWPPDPGIDFGPYVAREEPNGIRLIGPYSPLYRARAIRRITLNPGASQVVLDEAFQASSAAPRPAKVPRIGIWSITQVPSESTIFLPLNAHSVFPGHLLVRDGSLDNGNFATFDSTLMVTNRSNISARIAADTNAGWMAAIIGNATLFTERFEYHPGARYPNGGTNAQIFCGSGKGPHYIEMEIFGELASLKPGDMVSRRITWNLQHLSRAPRDGSDACQMVRLATDDGR